MNEGLLEASYLVLYTLKAQAAADVFHAYVDTTTNLPLMSRTVWKEQQNMIVPHT